MNSNIKTLVFWVVLVVLAVLLFTVVRTGKTPQEQPLTFTEFLDKVNEGQVARVEITGNEVHGVFQNPNMGLHTFVRPITPTSITCFATRKSTLRSRTPAPAVGSISC